MPGVSVAEQRGRKNVSLAGACWEPGGWTETLNVPDYGGDLGEVCEADQLRHQGNSRPRGRSHRSCAGPACADDHTKSGELILGLYDGKRRLSGLRVNAVFLHIVNHLL